MTNRTIQALLRADRAVVGAFVIAIMVSGTATAVVPHTEQVRPVTRIAAVAVPSRIAAAAPSPTELALMEVLRERRCLAEAMYYEARGEGTEGEKAIAEVVFNRMRLRAYPATICGVVYEGADLRTGCQFSFTCTGALDRRRDPQAWAHARLLAARIMTGAESLGDETGNATSYHAADVQPVWADTLLRTVQIGNHIFYREPPHTRSS